MKLIVEGMTCGHCVRTVTAAIRKLDASALVQIDLAAREVRIDDRVDLKSAINAIESEGYVVTPSDGI